MLAPVMANDMPHTNFELYMAAEGYKNTTKHYGSDAENGAVAEKTDPNGGNCRRRIERAERAPVLSIGVCPVSPLKIPKEAAEVILVTSKYGIPSKY